MSYVTYYITMHIKWGFLWKSCDYVNELIIEFNEIKQISGLYQNENRDVNSHWYHQFQDNEPSSRKALREIRLILLILRLSVYIIAMINAKGLLTRRITHYEQLQHRKCIPKIHMSSENPQRLSCNSSRAHYTFLKIFLSVSNKA